MGNQGILEGHQRVRGLPNGTMYPCTQDMSEGVATISDAHLAIVTTNKRSLPQDVCEQPKPNAGPQPNSAEVDDSWSTSGR
jgi:hypothetical protein